MIKQFTCLVVLLLLFFIGASAQATVTPQTVNVSGGYNDDPTSYYRYEWSIGESTVIQTYTSPTLIVTAGVLQPGTATPGLINNSTQWGTEEIKVFPNPVITELEVDILSKQVGKVNMMLYDALGRLLGTKQFDYNGVGQIVKWSFGSYSVGHYILKVTLDAAPGFIGKKGAFKVEKLTN
jgi:hypothetical protein